MFELRIKEEQKSYAFGQVNRYDWGRRTENNGNKEMQTTGILAQTCLADALGLPRPNGNEGFDGGIDFVINGKLVDLKTMRRSYNMRDDYSHNLLASQTKYKTEWYIFASYNTANDRLQICGCIEKEKLLEKADYFFKGEPRPQGNGNTFICRADMYEINQMDLIQLSKVEDIWRAIK